MCTVYRLFLQVNEKTTYSIHYQNNINKLHKNFLKNILRNFKRVLKSIMTSRTSLSSKKITYECSINTIELLIYYQFNYSLKEK